MALPFGLGCAISWGLYHEFRDEEGTVPIAFGTYMLFIGVAMAITVGTAYMGKVERTLTRTGLPGALPYPDRAEAAVYSGWHHCALCWRG